MKVGAKMPLKRTPKPPTTASIFARVTATMSAAGAAVSSWLRKSLQGLTDDTLPELDAIVKLASSLGWHVLRFETLDGIVHWQCVIKSEGRANDVGAIIRIGMACTRSSLGMPMPTIARVMPATTMVTCLACVAKGPENA